MEQNQKDLPDAIKANEEATSATEQGVLAVDELLDIDSTAAATAEAAAVQTGAAGGRTGRTGKGSNNSQNGQGRNGRKGARAFIA